MINQGVIDQHNLKKSKIDLSELLVQCRINGYFDIAKIQTAILEENGKLSFLPKSSERPVTLKDIDQQPEKDYLVANVIMDGRIMEQNLKMTGNDIPWLTRQLSAEGIKSSKDVLLATCDVQNKLTVYKKNQSIPDKSGDLVN